MWLRERRLARGWSQEQLAERSGLSVRTIQRVENGDSPGLASMTALAAAFGLGVDELVTVGQPPSAAAAAPAPVSFPAAVRICLSKYASFEGRGARPEYWWFVLFVIVATGAATLVHERVGAVVLVLLVVPLVAAGARRLHDTDRSGWWQLLGLVPFGGIVPLILLAQPSRPRDG
jgi:transcriptional regulator with XRE-family HTH domain